MRLLLATAVVAAAAADSPDCPVSAFMCSANSSGLATPDWCRGNNPVLVAIPPSRLASVSTDMATYQRVYSCDSTDPFSSCALIDNFFAGEYPVGPAPNASTIKLVVVAGRDGLNGVNASLALYDAQFNFITAPVVDFQGRLNLLDAQPNPATNGSTTLVGYGGTTRLNYYNASDNACAERGCMQVNLVEMNAGVNLTTYSVSVQRSIGMLARRRRFRCPHALASTRIRVSLPFPRPLRCRRHSSHAAATTRSTPSLSASTSSPCS